MRPDSHGCITSFSFRSCLSKYTTNRPSFYDADSSRRPIRCPRAFGDPGFSAHRRVRAVGSNVPRALWIQEKFLPLCFEPSKVLLPVADDRLCRLIALECLSNGIGSGKAVEVPCLEFKLSSIS